MASLDPQSQDPQLDSPWWKSAVVYQIYPRSFADSDGDGIGDLPGVLARLDHLHRLGVDVLWLSPVYTSPQADNGYDISDYCDIDPLFGTLADLDALVAGLHERGMKLVMDLVVNHTSDEHPWFAAALAAGPGSRERDRYFFRAGTGPDGDEPPKIEIQLFGGPPSTPSRQIYQSRLGLSRPARDSINQGCWSEE
jgi:alpha-glucosidase